MSDIQTAQRESEGMNGYPGDGASILAAALAAGPLIRSAAEEAEELRTLPPAVVEALRDIGVFRLSIPRELGGPEVDPLAWFEVLEALSMADGAAGWVAYIHSEAGYFHSRLDPDVFHGMYPSLDIATGTMHRPVGRAEVVEGGYRISGRWDFCSGVPNSEWMVFHSQVYKNGEKLIREDGLPERLFAYFSPDQYEVIDTWYGLGLRGSGSHDVEVTDVFVPSERTFDQFDLTKSPSPYAGPMYRFRGMFIFGHAAVVIGMARAALDAFTEQALAGFTMWGRQRDLEYVRVALAEATSLIYSARAYALDVMGDIMDTLVRGEELSVNQRAQYRIAVTHAHRAAVEAIEALFQAAGSTSSVRAPNVLERCLRDARTANQHIAATPMTLPTAGGMLLGDVPNDPTY
jgi:alkylation response protein AidB-like acyl-CoA dehydrogenase